MFSRLISQCTRSRWGVFSGGKHCGRVKLGTNHIDLGSEWNPAVNVHSCNVRWPGGFLLSFIDICERPRMFRRQERGEEKKRGEKFEGNSLTFPTLMHVYARHYRVLSFEEVECPPLLPWWDTCGTVYELISRQPSLHSHSMFSHWMLNKVKMVLYYRSSYLCLFLPSTSASYTHFQ